MEAPGSGGEDKLIKITIVGARGLRDADWFGKSDPYCVCEIQGKSNAPKIQTKVVPNCLDPVWNHHAEIKGFKPGDSLVFRIYDKDFVKRDDFLGTVTLASEQFYPRGFEGELPLTEAGKGINAFLILKIEVPVIMVIPVTPTAPATPPSGTGGGYPPALPSAVVPAPTVDGPGLWNSAAMSAVAPSSGPNSRLQSPLAAGSARLRLEAAQRAGSTGSTRMALGAARAAQDQAILTAVRRQMEALEEKLAGQISRVQQQSDRLRDAAYQRVDQKMASMEALQPKFDRRLAELSGNYKGLSDEMQAQIKRVDQLDSRLWEWRHQLEEDIRSKVSDIEQHQQKVSSSIRLANATNDDSLKRCHQRVLRLERLVEERLAHSEDTSQSLLQLHDRLSEVEGLRTHELALVSAEMPRSLREPVESAADSVALVALERRCAETSNKMDMFQQERHELHVRVEAQEERLKSLRTLIEAKEENHRSLSDRVERMDCEGRLKELQCQIQELERGRFEHAENLELLQRRLQSHEQVHDEVSEDIRRLQAAPPVERVEPAVVELGPGPDSALAVDVQECLRRLCDSESRLDAVTADLQAAQTEAELAPRMAALVEQLKHVAPKVMDQELCVRELHEKVGRLEVEVRMEGSSGAGRGLLGDSALARLAKLEGEISRMKASHGPLVEIPLQTLHQQSAQAEAELAEAAKTVGRVLEG